MRGKFICCEVLGGTRAATDSSALSLSGFSSRRQTQFAFFASVTRGEETALFVERGVTHTFQNISSWISWRPCPPRRRPLTVKSPAVIPTSRFGSNVAQVQTSSRLDAGSCRHRTTDVHGLCSVRVNTELLTSMMKGFTLRQRRGEDSSQHTATTS